MAERKQGVKGLSLEINKIKANIEKKKAEKEKLDAKLAEIQEKIAEVEKEIISSEKLLADKQDQLKRIDYSEVLSKLETTALNNLTKKQVEALLTKLQSGDLLSVLIDNESNTAGIEGEINE